MTKAQRIVLIVYCLLVLYCCVWVPWHFVPPDQVQVRAGYAWLWIGPAEGEGASPDLPIIGLRLLAATALASAAFVALRRV